MRGWKEEREGRKGESRGRKSRKNGGKKKALAIHMVYSPAPLSPVISEHSHSQYSSLSHGEDK